MGLRAFWKQLFRDRDPLGPLGFDLQVNAQPDQLKDPVQVVVLNDDKTPMDFVVKILRGYLQQESEPAVQAMLKIHTKGEAQVAVLERVEAERLISKVEFESRSRGYPLACEARPL